MMSENVVKNGKLTLNLLQLVLVSMFLCSCMVNGQVVMRPEDVIAKMSGKTEDQVIVSLESNFTAYKNAAAGTDYAAIIAAAKKAQVSFEDAFYLLGDKDGSWRSAVYVKKDGSQAPFVSDKTKSTLGRGYISILHNLARMSLVVNDRDSYYRYFNRAISPDPKLFNYNLVDTGLEAPQQLEVTLLFSMRSSYRYFMEGHIDEAVEIAEILKLTLEKVTREYPRLWEVKGPELGMTYRHFYNSLTLMLANYYLISGDQAKAEDTVKYLVTNTRDTSLLVRSYLLMAVIKDRFKEEYYAKSYVEKALGMVKENSDNRMINIFLGSLPYHFVEKYLAKNDWLPGIVENSLPFKTSEEIDRPTEYFINTDANLIAAELFRCAGMKERMSQSLSRFEKNYVLENAVQVNDLVTFSNILVKERDWQRLADFVWPLVDWAEYYREIIANTRYAATAFRSTSDLFANLALALYYSDGTQVSRYADTWQISLGAKSADKNDVLVKVIQLAKSRGILNVLTAKRANELSSKQKELTAQFETKRARLLQDIIFKPTSEQTHRDIVPVKQSVINEWRLIRSGQTPGLRVNSLDMFKENDEALLEYCVAGDSVLFYTLTSGAIRVGILSEPYGRLSSRISKYYASCISGLNKDSTTASTRGKVDVSKNDTEASSIAELARIVLSETGIDASRPPRLHISPDKAIGMLPFDVLVSQINLSKKSVGVSYIPSASVLSYLRTTSSKAYGDTMLLLGDPLPWLASSSDTSAGDNYSFSKALRGIAVKSKASPNVSKDSSSRPSAPTLFERIPYTAVEVNGIENIMKGKGYKTTSLLAGELKKEKIKAALAQHPRILHAATHGVMSNEIPYILNPTLLLSATERQIDMFLQASEIEKYDLSSVDLVVLSACKTGIDVDFDSEGISGIAKSFIIAGAKNVLLTYWEIDDKATSRFMERLYTELASGVQIVEALSRTRNHFIASTEYRHPYYWGAFALFGGN